jgi:hypothetical protein
MSLNYTKPVVLSAMLALIAQSASASLVQSTSQQINEDLQQFKNKTYQFMIKKRESRGKSKADPEKRPSFQGRQGYRAYLTQDCRLLPEAKQAACFKAAGKRGFSLKQAIKAAAQLRNRQNLKKDEMNGANQAQNLVSIKYRDVKSLDKLRSGQVSVAPWSDTYWPIYAGVTSVRYNLDYVSGNWKFNRDYVYKNSCSSDDLSPAEKYDAIVGLSLNDANSLARQQAEEGAPYAGPDGEGVESWMGICHGWAPAAFMLDRPQKAVVVKAANGASLRLYPSDIKGMASLLWANSRGGNVQTNFIGRRCEEKNPALDSATGRIKDDGCRDVNAGAWHLALVNQVGVAKKSFVLDATYSYEVWNQPIKSYSFTYFNPQTGEQVDKLEKAWSKVGFSGDKFAKYRSPKAKAIVGVALDLEYVVETEPTHAMSDSESEDSTRTVSYLYDLEVDENSNIVGGEWYENDHPDFLWVPTDGSRAVTFDEQKIEKTYSEVKSWDPRKSPAPAVLQQKAQEYTADGLPLGVIVERLIKASNI